MLLSDWLFLSGDTPITFSGNSFAKWTLLESIENRLSLSLRIKTRKESASLMYAKGRVDYSVLEVKITIIGMSLSKFMRFWCLTYGPQPEKTCHPRSLISAFVICYLESIICKLAIGEI